MTTPANRPPDDDRDLIDAIPGLQRLSTSLQRAVGPSCLLGLIMAAMAIVIVRRFVKLPLPGMIVLSVVVWWFTLVVLVRFGAAGRNDD